MAQRMSKRLQKEFEAIQKNTHEMKVLLPNNDLTLWHVSFLGAKGTLYEGENFCLQLRFTNEYVLPAPPSPSSLPKCCSSGTSPSTSTSTPTASSASPSSTIVPLPLFGVVARPHRQLDLPVRPLHAQQRHQKNKTIQ